MDLNIFKKHEPSDSEHFWALVIGKNWVQSAIWRVVGDKTEVVTQGTSVSWDEDSEESLVVATDSSLSSAAANITDEVPEPSKVVFGLPPNWVVDGNITSTRIEFLKKVSKELELSPAGFVVIPEAIAHFLKSREGAPLNAILVGPSDSSIDVTLVQNGKIIGSAEVAKSISMGEDVVEGLAQIGEISQYPSRILLYSHKKENLIDARQQLLDTEWKDAKVSFMHTPKVDVLPEDIGISAVSLAGGAEVAQATGVIMPHDTDKFTPNEDMDLPEENLPQESDVEEVSPEELGFLEGVDIAEVNEVRGVEKPVVSQDSTPSSHRTAVADFDPVPKISPNRSALPTTGALSSLSGITSKLPRGFKFPSFGRPNMAGGKTGNTIEIILITVLALGILGVASVWYFQKATVTLFVSPKLLEKTVIIKVDSAISSADLTNRVVPGQTKEAQISGDKTTQASGTKTIGEAAKGTVVIYHVGTASTLKSGTIILGPNSLKFTLDQDIVVASASSIVSPSKTQTSVTSVGIGPDFNLSSNTEFSVANFSKSDYVARNDTAFSGGTSRSVSAVSDEDRSSLRKSLIAELKSKGLEQIKSQLGEDEILVDDSVSFEAKTETYSAKAGEEASTVKLTLVGSVKVLTVPKSAMNEIVKTEIQQQVPQGYTYREDQTQITYKTIPVKVSTTKKTETKMVPITPSNFEANIKANLLPQVKPDEISQKITGMLPEDAKKYLKTISGYSRAEIGINFRLPGALGTLPRISKNIKVVISSEQ